MKPIPDKVHQIWLGERAIPAHFEPWMASVRGFSPGGEYRLWRDQDLDEILAEALMPEVLSDPNLNVGLRSDILRYEVLRQQGGVYFDCDFEVLRPFSGLLIPGCLHYGDELSGRPGTAFLASPPGFEFWGFFLRRIRRAFSRPIQNWWEVVDLSGPGAFKSALNAWTGEWAGNDHVDETGQTVAFHYRAADLVAFWRELLYPYWYEEHTRREFTPERYPFARGAHHWGGSWQ